MCIHYQKALHPTVTQQNNELNKRLQRCHVFSETQVLSIRAHSHR